MDMPKTGKRVMDTNICWVCSKELVEPITIYKVHQRRRVEGKITSVHSECYDYLAKTSKTYRPIISGVSNDGS